MSQCVVICKNGRQCKNKIGCNATKCTCTYHFTKYWHNQTLYYAILRRLRDDAVKKSQQQALREEAVKTHELEEKTKEMKKTLIAQHKERMILTGRLAIKEHQRCLDQLRTFSEVMCNAKIINMSEEKPFGKLIFI